MGFAQNLNFLMNHYGLSNYQLAKELECHQTSVANWLSETTKPQKKMKKDVADIFGITAEELCADELPHIKGSNILKMSAKNPPAITGEGKDAVTNEIMQIVKSMSDDERILYLENLKTLRLLQEQGHKPDIQD